MHCEHLGFHVCISDALVCHWREGEFRCLADHEPCLCAGGSAGGIFRKHKVSAGLVAPRAEAVPVDIPACWGRSVLSWSRGCLFAAKPHLWILVECGCLSGPKPKSVRNFLQLFQLNKEQMFSVMGTYP